MRTLSSLAAFVSLAGMATAQFEGWEPGPTPAGVAPIPAGWTSVNASAGGPGTNPNWNIRNDTTVFGAFGGSTFAWANYNATAGANDISLYLISPLVTLANGAAISFYTRTVSAPTFPDRLSLVFNTTGSTTPADFTNVLLTVNPTMTTTGYPSTWTQFTATISGLAAPVAGRYAFHYNPTAGGPSGSNSDFIGIDDVQFIAAGAGTLASNTSLGAGCIEQFTSFYEYFTTTPSIDLSNSAFTMVYTGTGYVVVPAAATAFVPPSGAATNLGLGDDSAATVTLAAPFPYVGGTTGSLEVCSNGHVAVATNNAAGDFQPLPATFLGWTNPTWAVWRDFICTPTANVMFEQIGGVAYITWSGVIGYSGTSPGTTPSTFQFQFDTNSGSVTYAFQSMDTVSVSGWTGGEGWVVGYSGPGVNLDPGSTDLSALSAITLTNVDTAALALAATSRPITGTTWNLQVANIPATGAIGVDVFGTSDPGIDDLFFLGAPGCGLRASLDVTSAWLVAGATHGYSLPVPNDPALINLNVYTTSAVLQSPAVNAFGAITSNGVNGLIGNL